MSKPGSRSGCMSVSESSLGRNLGLGMDFWGLSLGMGSGPGAGLRLGVNLGLSMSFGSVLSIYLSRCLSPDVCPGQSQVWL